MKLLPAVLAAKCTVKRRQIDWRFLDICCLTYSFSIFSLRAMQDRNHLLSGKRTLVQK
jgi:hypothetical protein